MKGPFPPRTKKPPPAHKVKILCSFGGTFLRCQPNGKLRYIGGETRIISVDRFGINLSKLVSRVSELICPPTRLLSFSLKYRLPGEKEETVPLLVPISTDEDVHRMMADYDRLAVQGKPSRLRVFLVLRNDGSSSSGYVVGSPALDSFAIIIPFCSGLRDFNGGNGIINIMIPCRENSTNQEKAAHSSISPTTDVVGSGVQIRTTHHHVPAGIRYSGDSYDANVLRQNKMGMGGCSNLAKSGVNGSTNMGMGGLVYYAAGYNQPVGALNFPSEVYNHCLFPTSTSVEGKDRENISPLNNNRPNSRTAKARSAPMSFSNQTNRRVTRVPPLKFFGKNDTLPCNPLPRIKNFRVVESDIGYHWCGHSSLGHRSGLHNLEVRRDSGMRSKMCLGKSYPELRPRSNISKFGQARFTHGNLGRPSDGGNSRGISRNRILEPSYGRSPALNCHGNWVNCSHSSSPHDAGKNPIPQFGSITIEDPLRNPNLANNMVQCQPSCNNDPFSIPLQYSVIYDASTQCKTSSEANSRKLNIKQCSMQSMSTSNVGPVFSNSDSSSGISRKYVESISREPAYGSALPQLNSATQSDNVSLFADICSSRSFLDVLMHLSLSSSAEARLSAPCSSLDGSDVLEADMGTRGDTHAFTRNEVGLPSNHSVHIEDDNHSSRTLTENLPKKTDDNYSNGTSDISLEDAIDLQSKGKDSNPSIMEQQSLGTLDDLTHCDRHQDNMVSSSNTKEEANIKESTMFCSKVVGEASRKLSSVYSQLASEELQTINSTDLEEIRELGSGTYGTVFHGKWKGSDVAIKRLKPSCLTGGDSGEDRLVSDFWKEAQLLSQLHHPNVVAFYGVVTEMENLATVTEYMVNGSLKQVLRRKDRTIDRRKRVIIAMDAAFGMEYLHEKNIVHFDLKSHNFLVNMRDPHRPVCKIGDLGLSKVKQRTLVSGGVRGTIPWMAPELLTSENSMVTEKVDVYSFGIVMWELLTGEEPYDNMRTEEIIAGIIKGNMRPEIPCWCDPTWRLLIERCWSSDPCSRPAFSEIAKELRTVAASMNVK